MAPQSQLEQLPVEVFNHVLSFLVYPRSRLPGLTERQSHRDYKLEDKRVSKDAYHLNPRAPPDCDRFGANLFESKKLQHPFNVLAYTSKRVKDVVENFCKHLVKLDNRFNLLLATTGPVYPDLSLIVYRRLWLQYAPRYCIFCCLLMSKYPHQRASNNPLPRCIDCFYAQAYSIREAEERFHFSRYDLTHFRVRGSSTWVLGVDADALALKLYGSKAVHNKPFSEKAQPCRVCLEAGTLARVARIRRERESRVWSAGADPTGDIVTRRSDPKTGITPPSPDWVALLTYKTNEYLYDGADVLEGGFLLRHEWWS